MKLNEQPVYNLKIRVKDYIVDKEYGFCILADYIRPANYLDMDVHEFQHLYDAVCNMKDLIEKERIKNDIGSNTGFNKNGYENTRNS